MDSTIQGLIDAALGNIKEMVNVNTIVGNPVETPDGTVIIPISKVAFGFAAGGSDFAGKSAGSKPVLDPEIDKMFGGGSGGGVSITPMAFMIVGNGQVRLMPVDVNRGIIDQLVDQVPTVIDKVNEIIKSNKKQDKDDNEKAEDNEGSEI